MLQLPLFVFGSLRRGECNHHYLAGAYERVIPARLPGFERVAPLMIARAPSSEVIGELFFLTAQTYEQTLQGCDALEELPTCQLIGRDYRRIPVQVQFDTETFVAWAYSRPDVEPDAALRHWQDAEAARLVARQG